MAELTRCAWCGSDPLYQRYHDLEWGVPVHDDRTLFEYLTLEGAQAGLSWIIVLRKREAYRAAFAGFDPARVAEFGEAEIAAAVSNPGLVRHEGKIRATIGNARALLEVRREFGSFDAYQWRFVEGPPLVRAPSSDIPVSTDVSVAFSKDLKRRGFKFVGPTIMYAYMQAVGMVNDHLISCFRYAELNG